MLLWLKMNRMQLEKLRFKTQFGLILECPLTCIHNGQSCYRNPSVVGSFHIYLTFSTAAAVPQRSHQSVTLLLFFLLRSRTNHVARGQGNVAPNTELYLYLWLDVYSLYYCHSKFFEKVTIKISKRTVYLKERKRLCSLLSHKKINTPSVA